MLSKLFGKKTPDNLSFIFGCPRGGTTWLWSMLESHQDVVPFVNEEKNADGKYSTSESGIYIRKPKQAKRLLTDFCNENGDKRVIEKTPSHTLLYRTILDDFPNSKHIVILRNPLAVANSMVHSKMEAFEEYNIDKSIAEIKKYYAVLAHLCTKTELMCITYEQLLEDTEFVMLQVFAYLGLSDANIGPIVVENKGSTKVLVKGAFRSGKKSSYLTELDEAQLNKLNLELKADIAFYNSQYERFENSYCN